jgi:ABC-type Na+ efflux pump permease subunit
MKTTLNLFLASLVLIAGQAFAQSVVTDPVGFTTLTVKPASAPESASVTPNAPRDAGVAQTGGNNVKSTHDTTANKPSVKSRPTTKHTKPPAKK